MASKSSLPIALGLAGLGSLYLISGIQGKSLGSVFSGDIGTAPNPSGSSEPTPAEDAVASQVGSSGLANADSYPGHELAANPLTLGSNSVKKTRSKELTYGIEQALKYKEKLETEIHAGRISQKQGQQFFQTKYPWYTTWTKELKALL